ncbi:hypothetical protein ABEF95_011682 [Exophiala dermatitidis]
MAANMNAAQAALANAINSLTPAQFSAFSASLAAAGLQTTAPVAAGAMTEGSALAQPVAPLQTINPNSNLPGNQAGAGRMKPLNAFITYRTYYSPLFKGLTQKEKSGLLRVMWGAELQKPMWTLLGLAYSDLRDYHDEHLPVDAFLAATVPLLPIVPAEEYFAKMGWENATNSAGELTLTRSAWFDTATFYAQYPPRTDLSFADIVNHCYDQGIMKRDTRRATPRLRPGHQAQAPAANNNVAAPSTNTNPPPPSCGGSLTFAVTPQSAMSTAAHAEASTSTTASTVNSAADPDEDTQMEGVEMEQANVGAAAEIATETPAYLSIEHVTADQQAAFERNPLALHFHPGVQPPILGFDPRIIQDDFDPFDLDLSTLIDWEV